MKKRFMLLMALVAGVTLTAQDDLKNFRFGLKIAPSVNWYKPENTKKQESDGALMRFSGGLITEFRLTDVISFATGLEITMDGGKINYIDSAYYLFGDDEIIRHENKPYNNTISGDTAMYRLGNRKFSATYVTLPLSLKMKTKEIGMLTYFGQFGFNPSIRWKAKAKDEVYFGTLQSTQENLTITKDMNILNMALNFGAGAEYNISGSTSLVFGLNFNLGFTPTADRDSDFLFERKNSGNGTSIEEYEQDFKSRAVILNVGVLF